MSAAFIDIAGLRYAYPDGTSAIEGVSLSVAEGESVAVVGANGAGKSTLLLHLGGVIAPSEGSVRIGGIAVTDGTLPEVRKIVGTVFQDPDDQLFMPSVYEDVAFGPVNLGLGAEEIEARVVAALECVGATGLRDRAPHRLSSGEKRAVAIATVLAMRPRVLVMDEPTSNLDPRARRRLISLIGNLVQTRILATHDLDMAAELCERTVVLDKGRVAVAGPTADVLRDGAMLERCGLEVPLGAQRCPICGKGTARRRTNEEPGG